MRCNDMMCLKIELYRDYKIAIFLNIIWIYTMNLILPLGGHGMNKMLIKENIMRYDNMR